MKAVLKKQIDDMSEDELKEVLRREYLRKLTRYRITDDFYRNKYSMDFNRFEKENIVGKQNCSFEVESDAQEWELAIDGIKTIEKNKLNFALVLKKKRLYGYDSEGSKSHCHPFHNPDGHVFLNEKKSIREFVLESMRYLEEKEIL